MKEKLKAALHDQVDVFVDKIFESKRGDLGIIDLEITAYHSKATTTTAELYYAEMIPTVDGDWFVEEESHTPVEV